MRKVLSVLVLLAVLCCGAVSARASQTYRLLDDGAGLLTESEATSLENKLQSVYGKTDTVVAVVTRNGISQPIGDFADSYFDQSYGSDTDGILLALDMDERAWYISTNGYGRAVVPDSEIDDFAGKFTPYLSSGNYYGAFCAFAEEFRNETEDKQEDGITAEYVQSGQYKESNAQFGMEQILIPLVIAFVIALITVLVMKSNLKTVRHKAQASDYVVPGSLCMRNSRDLYLFTTTTKVRRESNSGSGRSGGHSGSHGGGGGHF